MKPSILLTIALVTVTGKTAAAEYGDPAYTPKEKGVVAVMTEWMPTGWLHYTDDGGVTADMDPMGGFGVSAVLGYEIYDRIELGVVPRYIARVGQAKDQGSGHELDLAGRIAIHSRPTPSLDVAFTFAVGYSSVHLWDPYKTYLMIDDPSGMQIDVGGQLTYPVGDRLYAIASIGYIDGFQKTTSEMVPGRQVGADFDISYMRVGAGLARRF